MFDITIVLNEKKQGWQHPLEAKLLNITARRITKESENIALLTDKAISRVDAHWSAKNIAFYLE